MTEKNPHFSEPEILYVSTDKVACDGGNGPMGHPRVYLALYAEKDFVECPYCDRRFIRDGKASQTGH